MSSRVAPPASRCADDSVLVREGDVVLAACAEPGWLIASVDSPLYGNAKEDCNSTGSYK